MAFFLNGKQIDKENVYADNIPMSASDSDTIADKFDGLNATNLPIQSGSATNTKDYIDSGLSGKADKTSSVQIATYGFSKTINATTEATFVITRTDFNLPVNATILDGYIKQSSSVNTSNTWAYACITNPTSSNAMQGAIYNPTNSNRVYSIMATVFYTLS